MKRTILALLIAMSAIPAYSDRKRDRWVEQTMKSMTLDEKIGQLFVPSAYGGFKNQESDAFAKYRSHIVDYHVGGYNVALGDPASVALMINSMQRLAKVPLLITGDLEGGAGYVFPGATRVPLAMAIGATDDESLAYEAGKIAAKEGRALGFHVNYYPVADVNINPVNPIISIRSFGENPERVSAMVKAYVRGCQENGLLCTAKHFPGHGDVAVDSHLAMPVLAADRARLDRVELPPFRAAIDAGVAAIMTAHISFPLIEPDTTLPATLSSRVVTSLLREDLGFKGLIFTDALDMGGVLGKYGEGEVAIRSLDAGNDILLFPNVEVMFPAVKAAVESGRIPMSRIEQSVRRVLEAKWNAGLAKKRFVELDELDRRVATREHREAAQKIMDHAVTLVRNQNHAIPLRPSTELRLLHVNVLDNTDRWINNDVPGPAFTAELRKRFPKMTSMQIDDKSSPDEIDMVRRSAQLADAVIVATYILTRWAKGTVQLPEQQVGLLRQLAKVKKPFIFVGFGSPYVLRSVPQSPSYVAAYDNHSFAQIAAAKAITGEIEFRGKAPVQIESGAE